MSQKVIAVDYDGVIHDYKNPVEGRRMGGPMFGAKESLEAMQLAGFKVVVYTVRATSEEAAQHIHDWLQFYGIPYDEVSNVKPNCVVYIDDKAVRFASWGQTMTDLLNLSIL